MPSLLLEIIFVLEAVADTRWHVDQFLAPQPVRVVVDLRGADLTADRTAAVLATEAEDAPLQRFLERPGFKPAFLATMLAAGTEHAESRTRILKDAARERATARLTADLQRLIDLRKLNDHVRPEEIALAQERLEQTRTAIDAARLRLDSLRLVVEGPGERE